MLFIKLEDQKGLQIPLMESNDKDLEKAPKTEGIQAVRVGVNNNDIVNDNVNNNNRFTKTYNEIISVKGKKGTYLSYILMILGMIASIIANIYTHDNSFFNNWLLGCPEGLDQKCLSSQVILRFSFALVCIFTVNLIGTTIAIDFYDKHWVLKYLSFIGIVIGFYYASPNVFNLHGYAWFARIAAFFFLLLQQIILLDFAYTWNEKWVAKSEENPENGKLYLIGLLVVAILLFAIAISGIGIMFHFFSDCTNNKVIISLTLVFGFLATVFQLFFTDNGSILTSSIIFAYCTYICYSSISLNPNLMCNPTLSTNYQNFSVVVGMVLTVISVTWATSSTISKVPEASINIQENSVEHVMSLRSILQEISIIFILASSYYAMVLTNWSTLKSSQITADPRTGTDSMWLQASALFICLILYIWSLIAPKLFPDRDFSSY